MPVTPTQFSPIWGIIPASNGLAIMLCAENQHAVHDRGDSFGAPQEAVTRSKQRQISRLANAYVSYHRLEVPCRFDVAEVWLAPDKPPRLQLHENAFDFVE